MDSLLSLLDNAISAVQTWLFIDFIQPALFQLGLMSYADETYDAFYWIVISVVQVLVSYALLRPLEAWRPAETWSNRAATRPDILYTWITKLGLVNITFFFLLQPLFNHLQSMVSVYGVPNINLDQLWPGVTDHPIASFLIYLVALDFAGYWYHRWQHSIGVWWELHAVHHSQRQLSLWSDDRNHFLDDILQAAFFAALALFIGVAPTQYIVLVAVGNFLQSVQHANIRLPFGPIFERLLVSPAFHRRHHALDIPLGTKGGWNFGVLLPWWDMMFGTASRSAAIEPTGIREELPAPAGAGRSYGKGVLAQQWLALVRIAGHLRPRRAQRQASA
jgi:sterol desaturase/sphingolipid hydroxylase (fatty acid hydroxylase superfamily)